MAQFELWFRQDLKDAIHVQCIPPGDVFQADANSTLIGVELTDGGEPASLSGYGVAGYCIREDGTTLVQAGTISGNRASIVVPSNALTMVGKLDIVIKLTKNSDRITVLAVSRHVCRTTTDVIDVPEHLVPSLDELLAEIESIETGMVDANDLAILAPGSTAPQAITAGQYLIWNGGLHRARSNIAAGTTLSNSNVEGIPNGGLNALGSEIVKRDILKISTTISDTDTVAANRLVHQWSSFISYLQQFAGTTTGFAHFDGIIAFPAYSTGNNLGSFWAFGEIVLSSGAGTVVLTQYHGGAISVIRWHTDNTYDIYQQNLSKMFTVAKQSSATFNVANNSRIRLDFFGGSNGLPGSAWISATSAGAISKQQTGASEITITSGTNTITIANAATSAASPIYCTIYDGNITEAT